MGGLVGYYSPDGSTYEIKQSPASSAVCVLRALLVTNSLTFTSLPVCLLIAGESAGCIGAEATAGACSEEDLPQRPRRWREHWEGRNGGRAEPTGTAAYQRWTAAQARFFTRENRLPLFFFSHHHQHRWRSVGRPVALLDLAINGAVYEVIKLFNGYLVIYIWLYSIALYYILSRDVVLYCTCTAALLSLWCLCTQWRF